MITKTYVNTEINPVTYKQEVAASSITIALETAIYDNGDAVVTFKADISIAEEAILDAITSSHDPTPVIEETPQLVSLSEHKNSDGVLQIQPRKSFCDSSKSFTSPDFSNRQTWWFDTTAVVDEVMIDAGDHVNYTSTRTPTTGWDHDWIEWKKIPNNARQIPGNTFKIVVKKNDVILTSGFHLDNKLGKVIFAVPNASTDVIKVSYHYANSSNFELESLPGKILQVDYIEVQFSEGCIMPEGAHMVFEAVYNGPALPADSLYPGFPGYPANTDLTVKTYEYHNAADFMNEATGAEVCLPFMELTKSMVVLPWNYLTGHTLKPAGDPTTNIAAGEFNKLRMRLVSPGNPDPIISNCEIATGTMYCIVNKQ